MSVTGQASRIRVLDASVINKIAAGEVIERPASIVKECLENSLDALATRIDVEVEQGGIELIRIVDNGEGIDPDDLHLAVTSHATSKLIEADDLFEVQTMGFRGEALASIAEVSRLKIRSLRDGLEHGAELSVDCGSSSPIRPCGCPQGTQIEVRQLFCNTPVRRRFLKKAATEFGYLSEQFQRVALANPRLSMSLKHQGKLVLDLPSTDNAWERLRHFWGQAVADKLIPVEAESGEVRLWGYVSNPSLHKPNRKSQYLFLNGRYIQDRSLQHALTEAYRGLVMGGRYPMACLFLEMPSDQVDVNVHPTKSEVRFRDGQFLFRLILSTLRTQFLSMDFQSSLSIPSQEKSNEDLQEKQRQAEQSLVEWAQKQLEQQVQDIAAQPEAEHPDHHDIAATSAPREPADSSPRTESDSATSPEESDDVVQASVESGDSQQARPTFRTLQVDDCYLVLATDQGLTVIDQHALHERIMFERLRTRILGEGVEIQKLLVPITLEIGEKSAGILEAESEFVQQIGFLIEPFGTGTIAISGYPVMLAKSDLNEVLEEMITHLEQGKKVTREDLLENMMHMMACKAAVKAGDRLSPDEIMSLLAQGELTENAHHCPHGRPTTLTLSREDLDRQFGRLGAH